MTSMLPYLALVSETCTTEVFNQCRTFAYLKAAGSTWKPEEGDCGTCCCRAFDTGDYSTPGNCLANPAPWFHPSIPQSADAYGALVESFDVESPTSTRVVQEGGAPLITIVVRLLAGTPAALSYLRRWVRGELSACCRSCDGVTLAMYEHCAPVSDLCAQPELWVPPLDLTSAEPPGIVSPPPSVTPDSGYRSMLRARFVSMDPLTDDVTQEVCLSELVAITFEQREPEMHTGSTCCTIDTWFGCVPGPGVVDFTEPEIGCDQCGLPCRCLTAVPIEEQTLTVDVNDTPVEPSYPELAPKPKIEPAPPECPPQIACVLDRGGTVTESGQIEDLDFGIPSNVVESWTPGAGSSAAWLTDLFDFLDCLGGQYVSGESTYDTAAEFLAACPGATEIRVATANIPLLVVDAISNPVCQGTVDMSALLDGVDTSCLYGETCVSPTLDGEEVDGVLPFPLVYSGVTVADGEALAALMSTERGCEITWNDEFHPTAPCTYCIPHDCPRLPCADLQRPPRCVQPLVDGVQGVSPVPFPLVYSGSVVADGEALAALLSAERGCLVTWDEAEGTYCLPYGCSTGSVVALTTETSIVEPEPCYVEPVEVMRGACYVPATPPGSTQPVTIEICNTSEKMGECDGRCVRGDRRRSSHPQWSGRRPSLPFPGAVLGGDHPGCGSVVLYQDRAARAADRALHQRVRVLSRCSHHDTRRRPGDTCDARLRPVLDRNSCRLRMSG